MSPKIIIFSSSRNELQLTKIIFEEEGFEVLAFTSANQENINTLYKNNPDILLLDIDIEGSDGIELCYQLKKEGALNAFMVMFTSYDEDYIQVEAFKAGADDYILKPISSRLLVKKIKALLKRRKSSNIKNEPKILSYKELKIDRDTYSVIFNGKNFTLPRKEFEMLFLLINQPQKVFSREEIFDKVWRDRSKKNTRIIDVHIRKIREQIGQQVIKTVKGVGYQLA